MQKKAAPLVSADFYLAASDEFVAARADAALIEGRPFPPRIGGAQDIEPIFWGQMLLHAGTKRKVAMPCNRARE
jgi:hypothetical protein